ncbi:lipopolysaccharide biosynthesis regulator YciM [Geothermobacter ehrlichii]|uniref:Lipopolysaccharide biosynthesis regulator YciM n=1 Tax=Geothermobacter ehrlichii TaxID=213224 RepID=A0A5D3WH46_9BACT|nr:tetratricopeptide repeat protein [Geothermobacter ehrlichii]TYO96621.1 lipopolysaccharide biosynthesis regulator YciM [Geothermobacter ehrlichii]
MTILGFLLLIILFLSFFIYCSWLNPEDITLYYWPDHSITFSPALLILGFVLVGLVIGYGAHIYSLITHQLKHWRRDRNEKKAKEIETIYREGVSRLLSGDLKKARTLLQKALDRDPKRVDTLIAMANLELQDGQGEAAIKLLSQAWQIDPKNLEPLFKLASTHEEMGNIDQARAAYQEILALEAGNRKALRSLRSLAMKEGNWEEALELQKRVIKVAQGSSRLDEEKKLLSRLRYEVARGRLEAGKADEALGAFQELVKEQPDFVPARVSLGDAQLALNRSDEAVQTWQEGYRKLGRGVFLSRLEDHFMGVEDPASLLAFYRAEVEKQPDDMMLRLFFGKFCLRLEMVDEAIEQLQTVENAGVESSQLNFLLGEAYRRRDRLPEAIEEYQRALGTNKHLRLGYVCDNCGTPSEEWHSRCDSCSTWGSLSLINRQLFRDARPLEVREIHHGER